MTWLERIEELRTARGWSKRELAVNAGLPASTIMNLYTRQSVPNLATISKICIAFEMSLPEFFAQVEIQVAENIT